MRFPEDVARRAKMMIFLLSEQSDRQRRAGFPLPGCNRLRQSGTISSSYTTIPTASWCSTAGTCGSFLRFPGAREVGIEFNSLSKTYGLAGARIGFAVGNPGVIGMLKALKSNIDYGMFFPLQDAAIAAIVGCQDCVESTRAAYQARRDILVEGLRSIGWDVPNSPATMFLWTRLPKGYTDSFAFTRKLLETSGVLMTPGVAFGTEGEGHVRMALVADPADLQKAVGMIERSGILHP